MVSVKGALLFLALLFCLYLFSLYKIKDRALIFYSVIASFILFPYFFHSSMNAPVAKQGVLLLLSLGAGIFIICCLYYLSLKKLLINKIGKESALFNLLANCIGLSLCPIISSGILQLLGFDAGFDLLMIVWTLPIGIGLFLLFIFHYTLKASQKLST